MWIVEYSKDLLVSLNARFFSEFNRNKIYDFSTLYTTIPNAQLNHRLKISMHRSYSKNGGNKKKDSE